MQLTDNSLLLPLKSINQILKTVRFVCFSSQIQLFFCGTMSLVNFLVRHGISDHCEEQRMKICESVSFT